MIEIVCIKLEQYCECIGFIFENQKGNKKRALGAKELSIVNKNFYKEVGNKIESTWIDLKKAYNNLEHTYLIQILEKSKIPKIIFNFVIKMHGGWIIRLNKEGKGI